MLGPAAWGSPASPGLAMGPSFGQAGQGGQGLGLPGSLPQGGGGGQAGPDREQGRVKRQAVTLLPGEPRTEKHRAVPGWCASLLKRRPSEGAKSTQQGPSTQRGEIPLSFFLSLRKYFIEV